MSAAVRAHDLVHRYGRTRAVNGLTFEVPEGALYALLGPNGAGKTTLMKILLGLHPPSSGRAEVLGRDVSDLTHSDRLRIGYVAEGQDLPGSMTLRGLIGYLAPLYPDWDHHLASELARRFRLAPDQKIKSMSRGQRMKVSLLSALAPRPKLLIMDEPFTGMDAVVKDDLIGGLLELAGKEGWSVLLSSHDIGELEMLADWVGIMDEGRMVLSEPMEVLHDRFKSVDIMLNGGPLVTTEELPPDWLGATRSGRRLHFVIGNHGAPEWERDVRGRFPEAHRLTVRAASLREVFVAITRDRQADPYQLEAS